MNRIESLLEAIALNKIIDIEPKNLIEEYLINIMKGLPSLNNYNNLIEYYLYNISNDLHSTTKPSNLIENYLYNISNNTTQVLGVNSKITELLNEIMNKSSEKLILSKDTEASTFRYELNDFGMYNYARIEFETTTSGQTYFCKTNLDTDALAYVGNLGKNIIIIQKEEPFNSLIFTHVTEAVTNNIKIYVCNV